MVMGFERSIGPNSRMENEDKYYWTQNASHPGDLDLVNERLKEHWELYGSPFAATAPDKDPLFCQVMTRGGVGRAR